MQAAQIAQRKQFGQNIKKMREERGYSQYYFADLCEMERSSLQRIEKAEINPTLTTIITLCAALEVPISEVFADIKIPKLEYIGFGKTSKAKIRKKKK